ncbi:hypothetical protein Tco_0719301 [Tanacetum coccineum]
MSSIMLTTSLICACYQGKIDLISEKQWKEFPRGLTPREPHYKVVLDAIALTPCYPAFLITADVPEICPRVLGRDFYPLPSEEDTVSFLREFGHIGEINLLNDVVFDQMHQTWRTFVALINRVLSGKTSDLDKLRRSRAQILWESNQIYGAILPECLTSPAMKESKAYKTYLGYATGVVPPKIARKFKKASPSKKDSNLVHVDEEPITKGKRVKRSVKKSSTKPATGGVIREAPMETKSKSKEKENVDVTRRKGIELLSEVALTEEAQMKEVRKKSLRDFHKTHPSGSGTVAKNHQVLIRSHLLSQVKELVISQGFPIEQENESEEQVSDSEQEEESEDNDHEEEEFVHTPSPTNDKDDDNLESESDDTTQEQAVEDAYVTISTVTKKIEVLVTSSSCSSDLASKFLNFPDIPRTDAEIVSPLDVHVYHEVPRTQAPTLLTIPVSVIIESSPVYTNITQSSQTFTPPSILTTPNPPPTIETTNPLSILPNFASVFRFNNRIIALEKSV